MAWQAFSGQWASPRQLDADLEEIDQLKQAFRVLRKAPPGVKKRIIEASAMAVMHDEKITPDERALIGAAAIAMGIPIPQLGDQAA